MTTITITPQRLELLKALKSITVHADATTEVEDTELAAMIQEATPPTGRRIKHVCAECGEDALYYDASSYWCEEAQEWALSDHYSHDPTCGECSYEGDAKTLDADTGEELATGPHQWNEYLPKAEADTQWTQWRADNALKRAQELADSKAQQQAEENAAALAAYQEVSE